jgi:hypothetical protein
MLPTQPGLLEHRQKQIAPLRAKKPRLPLIATAIDEMKFLRSVIAPGMFRHGASLLAGATKSRDVRPRRPHLYKKRKVGQPPAPGFH